jgi:hypothetical protein
MAQSPRFEALIKDAYRGVYDTSKDATQIQAETLRQRALVGEELRERLRSEGDAIGMSNRLLGGMGGIGQGFGAGHGRAAGASVSKRFAQSRRGGG